MATFEATKIAELAVDLWRVHKRCQAELASERVLAACERAEDRYSGLGFRIESLAGLPFDTNSRAVVVEHLSEGGPLLVKECLSPAVYFNGVLIREAEIVTVGGDN